MRVRPSKSISIFSMIIGIAFVILGISVIIPSSGLFGVLWTVFALGITIYHGINAFSKKGIANFVVESDRSNPTNHSPESLPFDERLRKLSQLREEGLITESEFQQKRNEIMNNRW